MGWAGILAENVLAKNCLDSYKNIYLSQKDHKAFVYAREKETDKDRCNWGYGYASEEEAIGSAMKGCQSFVLNAECTVVDTDGVFKAENGAFSPLEPVDDTPLSKEAKKKLIAEVKQIIRGNCLPFFTKNYLEAKGHKSFAYSIDKDGNYACGYAYSNQTKKISKKSAISSCEENKIKRGNKKPKSACKVYASAHKILLKPSDFGINMEKKEEVFLSSEVYSKKLLQAQKIIDDGACLLQMKYYLRGEMQQAYYFAKVDGKQACGREEGAFTLKIAKEKAKKACENMAKKQNIKATCKLFAQNFEIVAKASDFKNKKSVETYEQALHKGNFKQLKVYISEGTNVNTQSKKDGVTALFLAAAKGDKDFFFALINKGADLHHKAKDKSTVLHAAVMGGNKEIVSCLIKKGLDINEKGFEGNTALHLSTMMMKDDISMLLTAAGANANIKNDKNERAGDKLRKLDTQITNMVLDEIKNNKIKKSHSKGDLHTTTSLSNAIQIAVKAMRKNLPIKIDDELQLTEVSSEGSRMILGYTLTNITSKDISGTKLKSLIYEDTKKQVCSDNETVSMLKKGMITKYTYQGKHKEHIANFSFDAKVCGLKTNVEQIKKNILNMVKKKEK